MASTIVSAVGAHIRYSILHTPLPRQRHATRYVWVVAFLYLRAKSVTNGSPKFNPLATHADADARMLRVGRGGRPLRSKGALIHISAKPSRTCVPGTHRVWGRVAPRAGKA